MAFGYPLCSNCRQNDATQPSSRMESLSKLPLAVTDNLLPPSIFNALQHAFRPESKYWSEFYCKANNDAVESISQKQRVGGAKKDTPQQKKINQFASHNIPLPINNTSPSLPLLHHLEHSKSLLEQVAIIAQHQLKKRFPELVNATSVEVWSHRRPPDGQHQLHYDMDEILLWKHRKESKESPANDKPLEKKDFDVGKGKDQNDTIATIKQGDGTKRQKTSHGTGNKIDIEQNQCKDSGISCPIVSCVLTINTPSQPETCIVCGGTGNSAPTIICNQSILLRTGNKSNIGCLCYPRPNRLLAFEGSLLHGVVPGVPFAQSSTSSDEENGSYCSSDDCCDLDAREVKKKPVCGNDQRITLMLGFWREVCLTAPVKTSGDSSLIEIGPNVPMPRVQKNTWTEEFSPISISESDIAETKSVHANEFKDVDVLDPLWVPIRNNMITTPDEKAFGATSCSETKRFYGRFFLKSLESIDIDHEVLYGA